MRIAIIVGSRSSLTTNMVAESLDPQVAQALEVSIQKGDAGESRELAEWGQKVHRGRDLLFVVGVQGKEEKGRHAEAVTFIRKEGRVNYLLTPDVEMSLVRQLTLLILVTFNATKVSH